MQDCSYRIGSSYWYYYEHEEKRQAGAVAWFESAKAGFEGNPEKEQEWKRASTYVEIGNFYQRIVPAPDQWNRPGDVWGVLE